MLISGNSVFSSIIVVVMVNIRLLIRIVDLCDIIVKDLLLVIFGVCNVYSSSDLLMIIIRNVRMNRL